MFNKKLQGTISGRKNGPGNCKRMLKFWLLICLAFAGYADAQSGGALYKDSDTAFIRAVLTEHNNYRAELHLPALTWSSTLAEDARTWGAKLAKSGKGQHDMSVRGKEGENLWWGTAGAYTWENMVDFWGDEKQHFVYGPYPDCVDKKGSVVGHYTQMIWRTTTQVGCALVSNGDLDFLVCRYSAPGNMVGSKPY